MSPRYCRTHQHWVDGLNGPCLNGLPSQTLTRLDVTRRLGDLDNMLGDEETLQSNGYYTNKALEAERLALRHVREAM